MKRWLLLVLGIAVSLGCFAWSMRGIKVVDLTTGIAEANYLTLPLMLALLFAFYWLKTLRWMWLLVPVRKFQVAQLFPPMMIGFAANNVLPAHLGEFVRVLVVRRKYNIPAVTVLSTVVLERVFDIFAILGLFAVGLTFTEDLPEQYRQGAVVLGAVATCVVLCVIIYLIWTEAFIRFVARVAAWLPFLPHSLTEKVLQMLRTGAHGLLAIRNPLAVTMIVMNSLLQWLMNGAIAYLALRSFGIPVTLATGLIVTGVTAFAVTVPSTPGYFGVIQAAFTASMASQSIEAGSHLVVGASLYYHISMYIPVTGIGLWFLHRTGLSLKDLTTAAATEETQPAPP